VLRYLCRLLSSPKSLHSHRSENTYLPAKMSAPEPPFIAEAATKPALKGHNHLYSQYLLNCKHSLKTARHGAQACYLILQKLYPTPDTGRSNASQHHVLPLTDPLPFQSSHHPSALAAHHGNANAAPMAKMTGPLPGKPCSARRPSNAPRAKSKRKHALSTVTYAVV